MNIKEILNLWSFLGNYEIKAAKDGTNNSVYFVDSQGGQFILKIYGNSTKTEQIEDEHSLLSYLSSQNISFQIPKPTPNNSGETILQIERNNIPLRVSLFAKIEGQNLDRNNLLQTRSAGKALGELQLACANFAPKIENLPSWGDLYKIHPSVKNPLEIPQSLPLTPKQQTRLLNTFTEVIEVAMKLYNKLPVQTVHSDYMPFNILVEGDSVVGVLDFEFSTKDLRLIDYIAALDNFASFPWQELPRWEFLQAFSAGYKEYISLLPSEIEAISLVLRLSWISSIIYWFGWFQEGKGTQKSVLEAVNKLFLLEDWFDENLINIKTISEKSNFE